jgi:hypothetical protein
MKAVIDFTPRKGTGEVTFQVLTAASMKMAVFWVVAFLLW